jgi:hypothetical protein
MDLNDARRWLVVSSLSITAAALMFFVSAPAFGYPLTWEQGTRIVGIIIPVFLGYLGSATHFLFQKRKPRAARISDVSEIGMILVRGPIVVFGLVCLTTLAAFGYSNRLHAPAGSGMSVDTLAWSITSVLGLLAVTTNIAVSYLFAIEQRPAEAEPKAG